MSNVTGRFPYATLHALQTRGMGGAIAYQRSLAGTTPAKARDYVAACLKTKGQPHLLDIFEREEAEALKRMETV